MIGAEKYAGKVGAFEGADYRFAILLEKSTESLAAWSHGIQDCLSVGARRVRTNSMISRVM